VVTVNARTAGELVPVMSSAGWVLYTSHNHAATGLGYAPPPLALELKRDLRLDPVARMDDALSRRIAGWVAGRSLGAEESSAFWRREAVARIVERGLVRQTGLQLDRLWFAIHAYDAHDNAALVAQDERMRGWPLVGVGLLAPLGLAGVGRWLARGRPGGAPATLAASLLTVPVVSLSAFYVVARFRLELIALLLPFAAWGVLDVVARRRPRRLVADLVWAALASAALAAAHLPSDVVETHRRRARIQLETDRGDRARDAESATFHYRRASEMARYPAEAAPADERLAAALATLDAPAAAQRARLRAAGVLPAAEVARLTLLDDDPDALWAIGRYRLATGDPDGAAAAFGAAHRLRPLDPEIGFSLAVAVDAGHGADPLRVRRLAADALEHGLRFSSDAPRAWRLVARQELGLGRPRAAAAASLEAVRLDATLPLSTGGPSSR
jgi:hypothetical protein